ncbi:hypothetical protein D9M70_429810 [compost metagenome]
MRTAAQEALVQRRGSTEQVHQQPAIAAEVADHRDVARRLVLAVALRIAFGLLEQRPERLGQGKVVVDAGNALHGLAVTHGQALAVDVLQAADGRGAVVRDGDVFLRRQAAGHGRAPEQFVAELVQGEAVDLLQVRQGLRRIDLGRRDELQQRFGIVRGDLRMGQRRAQGGGVWRQRQLAIAVDPQAFTLDAVQAASEQGQVGALAEQGQAAGKKIAQFGILHASVAPIWGWT